MDLRTERASSGTIAREEDARVVVLGGVYAALALERLAAGGGPRVL
jgi:hypothetical protein